MAQEGGIVGDDTLVSRVAELCKSLKKNPLANEHISLTLGQGDVFGPLGPNSALGAQAGVGRVRHSGDCLSGDLGTGYSSFGYLKRCPIDILKIPRDFVEGIDKGLEQSVLAEAILGLGGSLSMQVVAEGIENRE